MRALWIMALGLTALVVEGCKRNQPEPIPGPKAGLTGVAVPLRTPGIAWFQGSLEEAFARAKTRKPPPHNELRCAAPVRAVHRLWLA